MIRVISPIGNLHMVGNFSEGGQGMNREIKFRGKDFVTGEWIYGHYMPPFFEGDSSFIWVPENCNDNPELLNKEEQP